MRSDPPSQSADQSPDQSSDQSPDQSSVWPPNPPPSQLQDRPPKWPSMGAHAAQRTATEPLPLQRLHPTSVLFGLLRHAKGLLLPLLAILFLARDSSWERWAMLLIVPSALFEIYRYATTRYCVTATELVVRRGLLFRSERHVPLGRIQNVDLIQNPLHRLVGVAEVRIETAGGSEPEAILNVLSVQTASTLRSDLRHRRSAAEPPPGAATAAGAGTAGGPAIDDQPAAASTAVAESPGKSPAGHQPHPGLSPAPGGERSSARAADASLVLRIPTSELVRLGLISNRGTALIFVAMGVAWELGLFERLGLERTVQWVSEQPALRSPLLIAGLAVAALALLRLLSVIWTVGRFHGYELVQSGRDLRMSCGLFTRVTVTVPRRRIQLVSVRRSLFQRWWGRATVRIETAGSAGQGEEDSSGLLTRRWFVPTVRECDLPRVLEAISPEASGLASSGAELPARLAEGPWVPISGRGRRRRLRLAVVECAAFAAAGAIASSLLGSAWLIGVGAILALLNFWHAAWEIRVLAHLRAPGMVGLRSGAWTQQISIVPTARIQVLQARQSPFDRRWGMARVHVDTAGAGAAEHVIEIPYQDFDSARSLVETLMAETERLATAGCEAPAG